MKTTMKTASSFLAGHQAISVEAMRQFLYSLYHIEMDSETTDEGTLYRTQDLNDALGYTEDLVNLDGGPGMTESTDVSFHQRYEEAKKLADADMASPLA